VALAEQRIAAARDDVARHGLLHDRGPAATTP
jgi:hypothetical protein